MPPRNNRGKSAARKPLSDISNGSKPSRSGKKKIETDAGDGALDRLLLLRSDLAGLIGQIDELVAHAIDHKTISKKGSQLVQSFSNVLADMHSSLKPWVPRIQQAFASTTTVTDGHSGEPRGTDFICGANGEDAAPIKKTEPDVDLIVSPSPLVSWRVGACKVESGRQLFLLTPLPKSKILASGQLESFRKMSEISFDSDLPHDTPALPPLPAVPRNARDDLLGREELKPASSNVPKPRTIQAKSKSASWLPMNFAVQSSRENSIYLLTPCSKTSQLPKNCAPRDPLSKSSQQEYGCMSKPTLTDNDLKVPDDDAIEEVSQSLTSRYQVLLGLQSSERFINQRREVDGTLDWFLSPPKTCILMEPSDEKALPTPHLLPTPGGKGALLATPLWKDLESTVRKGKQPGENTLKKELWTKFEAVSTSGLHFDASVFQTTARKGFLDMLEEVSSETCDLDSGVGR